MAVEEKIGLLKVPEEMGFSEWRLDIARALVRAGSLGMLGGWAAGQIEKREKAERSVRAAFLEYRAVIRPQLVELVRARGRIADGLLSYDERFKELSLADCHGEFTEVLRISEMKKGVFFKLMHNEQGDCFGSFDVEVIGGQGAVNRIDLCGGSDYGVFERIGRDEAVLKVLETINNVVSQVNERIAKN
jgi:hypothetical protein